MANTLSEYNTSIEQQLLNRVREGEKGAFDRLFQRHHVAIYRYCLLIVGEKEAAEDIYQDTFYTFYRACRDGKEVRNVRGYLVVVSRTQCIDYLKRQNRYTSLSEVSEPTWEPDPSSFDTQHHLRKALLEIPHQYREAFVLHVLREYSYEEIAESLKVSKHVVKNRIYRAKQSLHKILSPILRNDKQR